MKSRSEGSKKRLDSYDEKILNKLAEDGRISWRQLAEHINLSQTPTLRRVHRLERDDYIAGYAAVLNEQKIFGSASLMLVLRVDPAAQESFEQSIIAIPQIVFCGLLNDKYEYLASISTETIHQAYGLIELIASIEGILEVTSHPLVKVVSRPPAIPNWRRTRR